MKAKESSLFTFNDELYEKCMKRAIYLVDNNLDVRGIGVDQLADTLYKLEKAKEEEEKNATSD